MYFVYLAQCKDGSIYTGSTSDVERRLKEHQAGKGGSYTRSHAVERVVHTEAFSTRGKALKREAQIKSWPRTEKLTLIRSSR